MKYDSILARSFNGLVQKGLQCPAFSCWLLIALCFSTVLKPSNLNLPTSVPNGCWSQDASPPGNKDIGANMQCQPRTEFCEISNRDVWVEGNLSSVFVVSSQKENMLAAGNSSWTIRPYARKDDQSAISIIRKWTVKQIIPVGRFNWISKTYYGGPSKDMNLKYMEYKISNEESTLIQQYPLDHAVFADPDSIGKQGWKSFKSIYLNKQNIKLNVTRFKALKLLHQ